jgi:hypothetical protein
MERINRDRNCLASAGLSAPTAQPVAGDLPFAYFTGHAPFAHSRKVARVEGVERGQQRFFRLAHDDSVPEGARSSKMIFLFLSS